MKFLRKLGLMFELSVLLVSAFDTALAQSESGKSTGKPLAALSGIDTLITNEMSLLIRDQEDWNELWQRHSGQRLNNEAENKQTLQVDFEKCMVLAVFGGKMFNCSGVGAYSLSEEPDRILFRNKLNYYQASGTLASYVFAHSTYGFFVLPRTAKPLVVERAVPRRKGQEYIFEPQAQFEPTGHTFGIYPVEGDFDQRLTVRGEGDWSKAKLAPTPIISKRDILSYDPANYTMRITAEAAARIPRPPVNGQPFMVVVDGQKIYLGVFATAVSSFSFAVPSICVDREGLPKPGEERILTIDRAYPGESFGKGLDPRSDERIRMSLK